LIFSACGIEKVFPSTLMLPLFAFIFALVLCDKGGEMSKDDSMVQDQGSNINWTNIKLDQGFVSFLGDSQVQTFSFAHMLIQTRKYVIHCSRSLIQQLILWTQWLIFDF
jgi:hypothetical protein